MMTKKFESIEGLLTSKVTADHIRAYTLIARHKDPKLLPYLIKAAKSRGSELEAAICHYLQNFKFKFAAPHLDELLRSPHLHTRVEARKTLLLFPIGARLKLMQNLLKTGTAETLSFVLDDFSKLNFPSIIPDIVPLLHHKNLDVVQKTLLTLQKLKHRSAIPYIVELLEKSGTSPQILCLDTLGNMSGFSDWKLFSTFFDAKNPALRKAAIVNFSKSVPFRKLWRLFPLLKIETDEAITKILIDKLIPFHKSAVVHDIVHKAATHKNTRIKRIANWALDKIDPQQLKQVLIQNLNKETQLTSYILPKLGQLEVTDAGEILTRYIRIGPFSNNAYVFHSSSLFSFPLVK